MHIYIYKYTVSQLVERSTLRGSECILTTRNHIIVQAQKMLFRSGWWHCAKGPYFVAGNRHFTQGRQVSRMAEYTNADMHLVYGAADCSGLAAQHLYEEWYRTRRISKIFFKPAPEVSWDRFISKSWQGAGENSTDSGHRTECASAGEEVSK